MSAKSRVVVDNSLPILSSEEIEKARIAFHRFDEDASGSIDIVSRERARKEAEKKILCHLYPLTFSPSFRQPRSGSFAK